jgi:cytochrome bd ubiquinol oxidase subunit I
VVYAIVFSVGALYILRMLAEGPLAGAHEAPPTQHRPPGWALGAAPENPGDAEPTGKPDDREDR